MNCWYINAFFVIFFPGKHFILVCSWRKLFTDVKDLSCTTHIFINTHTHSPFTHNFIHIHCPFLYKCWESGWNLKQRRMKGNRRRRKRRWRKTEAPDADTHMGRKRAKKQNLCVLLYFNVLVCFQWGVFSALWLRVPESEGGRRSPTHRQNLCCTGVLTPRKGPLMPAKHDWQEGWPPRNPSARTHTHRHRPSAHPPTHPRHPLHAFLITQSHAGLHSRGTGFYFHVAPKAKRPVF